MLNNTFSLVVSAPSGAGKTTIIERLLEEDGRFAPSISTTTRPRRFNEVEGESYYFVSDEEFHKKIKMDEFIEWAVVHGNHYGTTKKEIDRIMTMGKIPIFNIDVQGARELKTKIENAVFIFIVPPSLTVLRERLIKRETESLSEIEVRLKNAKKELQYFKFYDYIVVNNRIDDAIKDFKAIIRAEMCKTLRMEDRLKW